MFPINVELIQKLMKELGLNYHQLAIRSNCKPDTIRHIIQTGRGRLITIGKLSKGLGLSQEELILQ